MDLQEQAFLYGNDVGSCSSSKYPISATHESRDCLKQEPLSPFFFGMQRICGVFSSSEPCSSEQAIGLKLGAPATSSKSPVPSLSATSFPMKRSRASHHHLQNPCCQVEGCNLDLKSAKDYHRRHRICESHSKSPKVIVSGFERRFCQQCSRFHELSEFDDKKRSCRRRLSDHNARRRRVQSESLQLTSAGLSSGFYDHKIQQNLLLDGLPISQAGAIDATLSFSSAEMNNSLQLDSTRTILNPCVHVPGASSALDTDLLSAHSFLSPSLNESQSMEGGFVGSYNMSRRSDSDMLFFQHNNGSAAMPSLALMDSVDFYSAVAVDRTLECRLLKAPYDSGSFYAGRRNL